ncbi:hypothetical protein LTR91_006257 [Friedmanniomyces endolithicus]|uniref:Uncharacterized protein n=1 Tax=Friedmanniomyces endolithicus TaxID=329885 RepID=A0AAN6KR96_9PEZI|nr:hypothetical protein LTR35_003469 [Friedmanniomyces endolithicus]KAK0929012.1 hypothetical protein LTR57_002086 [Friedmanniomyces endolithicus]KAK0978900.1 hypothetical protein LTR54_015803 [Friedmanniomyces endolithicus]KAK0998608.1 hypothetical protein LTR91_006257 [Friedmanniomyces endolithicus]KAK1052201.1 hypothetical protein LTS16_001880 [Friedmanniomyces endolithicus]
MFKPTAALAKQASQHHVKPTLTGAAAAASATAKGPLRTPPHPPQQQYLRFIYDANPRPINCTTLTSTKDFANDPSHPFHIRTQRRLQAFDPKKLHWRVQCPMDVSRRAFRLGARDGKQEENGSGVGGRESTASGSSSYEVSRSDGDYARPDAHGLSGALVVLLPKDSKLALTATKAQVEASAEWVLEQVAGQQAEARRRGSYKPRLGR